MFQIIRAIKIFSNQYIILQFVWVTKGYILYQPKQTALKSGDYLTYYYYGKFVGTC